MSKHEVFTGAAPASDTVLTTALEHSPELATFGAGTAARAANRPDTEEPTMSDPAEIAFFRWLALVGALNAGANDDRDEDVIWAEIDEAACRIVFEFSPSPMAAGGILLHELAYAINEISEERSVAQLVAHNEEDMRRDLNVLRCLLPCLTGRIAILANDLLDNPDRPARASLLHRVYEGSLRAEEVLAAAVAVEMATPAHASRSEKTRPMADTVNRSPAHSAPRHVIDNYKLESALIDAQGIASLLELAIDNMGKGDAWGFMNRPPIDGYKLYLLTNDQVRAIHYAVSQALCSIDEAAVAFWGRELAHAA